MANERPLKTQFKRRRNHRGYGRLKELSRLNSRHLRAYNKLNSDGGYARSNRKVAILDEDGLSLPWLVVRGVAPSVIGDLGYLE